MSADQTRITAGKFAHSVEELMTEGFRLAYFIVPDRALAVQVLREAMLKLNAQQSRELKRTYWRDKFLKRKITRMVRDQQDALQWLIYVATEPHERQREQTGEQSTRDMIIRYVKYLVQATTAMSSFYVSVGLQRLLHNYSTAETRKTYEWVTGHFPGEQEYRRVKGILVNQIQLRFGSYLRIHRIDRGELRFDVLDQQHRWGDLVDECLRVFTPWSTRDVCSRSQSEDRGAPQLARALKRNIEYDVIELCRSHIFIEPVCHGKITRALKLDSRRDRLAIPMFFMNEHNGRDNGDTAGNAGPELTEQERSEILDDLSQEAIRRRQASPEYLKIVAQGNEYTRLDFSQTAEKQCWIPEGTKLIEIWAEDKGEDILLATHWVAYTEFSGIAAELAMVDVGHGKELLLDIRPETGASENRGAAIRMKFRSASTVSAWRQRFPFLPWFPKLPALVAAAACLVAIGSVTALIHYRHELAQQQAELDAANRQIAQDRAERASLEQRLEASSGAFYRLVPDEQRTRSGQSSTRPTIITSSQSVLLTLEIPIANASPGPYRIRLRRFADNQEILSEERFTPTHNNGVFVVSFVLSSSLLETGQYYVAYLERITASGKYESANTFTFYVVKK